MYDKGIQEMAYAIQQWQDSQNVNCIAIRARYRPGSSSQSR